MKTELFDYQKSAVNTCYESMIKDSTQGMGLFVDMGMGKSLMSLTLAEKLKNEGLISCAFIISPKALCYNWEMQIREHFNADETPAVIVYDSQKAKTKKYNMQFQEWTRSRFKAFIINIEAFQTTRKELIDLCESILREPSIMILDESSKIKTPTAARTKALVSLATKGKYKLILTGTDITNGPLDLYSQFKFLKVNFWNLRGMRDYYAFRSRYAVLQEMTVAGNRTFQQVVGYKKTDELKAHISPYVVRLMKSDYLDLPEKIYDTIYVEMNREQHNMYYMLKEKLMAEYKGQEITVKNKVALFTKFRQITGGFVPETPLPGLSPVILGTEKTTPKLSAILEATEDDNKKAIIWASFRQEIKHITDYINEKQPNDAVSYYGDMSEKEKRDALDSFMSSGGARFFVANPTVAGYGLNLQHTNLTYWYSRSLSPEVNWQSEDRQHRIGQKNPVTYIDVICKGTVDERILQILKKKTDFRNNFIKSGQEISETADKTIEAEFADMGVEEFFNLF